MGEPNFSVLDPTSHTLAHGHMGSNGSFTSLDDNIMNDSNGATFYRDNSHGNLVLLDGYSRRFGSIVSIAESESSVTSGACFSSEAGSLMQPDQGDLTRPTSA